MKFSEKNAAALAVADQIAAAVTDDLLIHDGYVRLGVLGGENGPKLRQWLASIGVTEIVAGDIWAGATRRDFHAIVDGVKIHWSQPVRVTVTVDED